MTSQSARLNFIPVGKKINSSETVVYCCLLPLSGAWGLSSVMVVGSQGLTQAERIPKADHIGENQTRGEG